MGKVCLSARSLSFAPSLLAGLVTAIVLTGLPAEAASNQVTSVLDIRVIVAPTVQAGSSPPTVAANAGSVIYSVQPSTSSRMSSQITVQPISTEPTGAETVGRTGQFAKPSVLQTTSIVVE